MGDSRSGYDLKAPGAGGESMRLPGQRSFPPVDEHLVEPEVTRDKIIGGRRVIAMPAKEPHATRQFQLDYVLEPHIAPGYVVQGNPRLLSREVAARSEGEARGEALGKAKAILQVLEARGIAVSEPQREEMLRCADLDQLDRWARRAALVSSAAEVLAG